MTVPSSNSSALRPPLVYFCLILRRPAWHRLAVLPALSQRRSSGSLSEPKLNGVVSTCLFWVDTASLVGCRPHLRERKLRAEAFLAPCVKPKSTAWFPHQPVMLSPNRHAERSEASRAASPYGASPRRATSTVSAPLLGTPCPSEN